ncbi:Uncharacterised protein [Klebsiella aerogenes]|nr:Uncharacterised protein [Klebsiella aerogenes]
MLVAQFTQATQKFRFRRHPRRPRPASARRSPAQVSSLISARGRVEVVIGSMLDLRRQRRKILRIGRLATCRYGEQRASVEGVFERDNAAFVAAVMIVGVFTRQFQRRFVGFGAGVTKENAVGKGGVDKLFGKAQRRFVGIAVTGMPEFFPPARSALLLAVD